MQPSSATGILPVHRGDESGICVLWPVGLAWHRVEFYYGSKVETVCFQHAFDLRPGHVDDPRIDTSQSVERGPRRL